MLELQKENTFVSRSVAGIVPSQAGGEPQTSLRQSSVSWSSSWRGRSTSDSGHVVARALDSRGRSCSSLFIAVARDRPSTPWRHGPLAADRDCSDGAPRKVAAVQERKSVASRRW